MSVGMKSRRTRRSRIMSAQSRKDSVLGTTAGLEHLPVELIPGIPEKKWDDMMVEDEKSLFVMEILRDEVLEKCFQEVQRNYLEKQVVYYTVHCLHLAWLKIINLHFLPHPPAPRIGASDGIWLDDEEPETVPVDPWAGYIILKQEPKKTASESADSTSESSEQTVQDSDIPEASSKLSVEKPVEEKTGLLYMLHSLSEMMISSESSDYSLTAPRDKLSDLRQVESAETLPERKLSFFSRMKSAPLEELASADSTQEMTLKNILRKRSSEMGSLHPTDKFRPPVKLDPSQIPSERILTR